jgi:hypothetical protein
VEGQTPFPFCDAPVVHTPYLPRMVLDNRELAVSVFLVLGTIWSLTIPGIRTAIWKLVRALVAWRIQLLLLLMLLYIGLEVNALQSIGLWDSSHVKDTILWTATVAFVLVMRHASGSMSSLLRAAGDLLGAAVVLDFIINFYVFPIYIELIVMPIMFVLFGILVFSEHKPEYKTVHDLIAAVLAIVGIGYAAYFLYNAYQGWGPFARLETAKQFLVPIALSLLFVPFVYLAMLYASYERFFARSSFYVKDPSVHRRFKWMSLLTCHISATTLERCDARLRGSQISTQDDLLAFFRKSISSKRLPPRGFRGLQWGDPPLADLKPFETGELKSDQVFTRREWPPFLGLAVSEEHFIFENDLLTGGGVSFVGEEKLDEVRVRLSSVFGPPSFSRERLKLWKWRWESSPVEIHLSYHDKFEQTTVRYIVLEKATSP